MRCMGSVRERGRTWVGASTYVPGAVLQVVFLSAVHLRAGC